MPNNIVKSFADKTGKSKDEVEKLWNKSKEIVKKEYPEIKEDTPEFFKLVTGILKKSLGLRESFRDFFEQ